MELKNISELLSEIEYLKNRSELLERILSYYDTETMTFIVPSEYKKSFIRVIGGTNHPKSPRHILANMIVRLTPYSEHCNLINWEKIDEK